MENIKSWEHNNFCKILIKSKERNFRILNLTDTQLSDAEWAEGRFEGKLLRDTVTDLVKKTDPDLITISGDLAWAGHYESYRNLAELMNSFDIPWAPVFGNHDNQGGEERVLKAAQILTESEGCLLQPGKPQLGCGNYVIGIEEDGRLIHGVILMDSHDRTPYTDENGNTILGWGDVIPEQLVWYEEQIDKLIGMGAKESSLVLHIPLYAYREAAAAAFKKGIDLKSVEPYNGMQKDCFNEGYEDSFGVCYEGIASYPADNGFFNIITRRDHTKTVICGHDHVNSFAIKYKGVNLIYSLKTGCGCYWDKRLNGATLLEINSDGEMSATHVFADV